MKGRVTVSRVISAGTLDCKEIVFSVDTDAKKDQPAANSFYVAAVCVVPTVISEYFKVPFRWGGTSIMIVVGVALDTVRQMESHLLMRNYEGFLRKKAKAHA